MHIKEYPESLLKWKFFSWGGGELLFATYQIFCGTLLLCTTKPLQVLWAPLGLPFPKPPGRSAPKTCWLRWTSPFPSHRACLLFPEPPSLPPCPEPQSLPDTLWAPFPGHQALLASLGFSSPMLPARSTSLSPKGLWCPCSNNPFAHLFPLGIPSLR